MATLSLLSCKQGGDAGSDITGSGVTPLAVATVPGIELFVGDIGGAGNVDGIGGGGRFDTPMGIALDTQGNLFVAEPGSHIIRRVTSAGEVELFSGEPGTEGSANGSLLQARYSRPTGVTVASDGSLYVVEASNHTVRKIQPDGEVVLVAGQAETPGAQDGSGSSARFTVPLALAEGPDGNLYVSDSFNHTIRKVTPAGVVTTHAGKAQVNGVINGNIADATFTLPAGLAFDSHGNLFLVDSGNFVIRKITPGGVVSTFAGSAGHSAVVDGVGPAARFKQIVGITIGAGDVMYVTDLGGHVVRRVTPAAEVTTLAGLNGEAGAEDGTGDAARFNAPYGIVLDGDGNLLVSERQGHRLRRISPTGDVTTLAGRDVRLGGEDGTGLEARFRAPAGLAQDSQGRLYVADAGNNTLRRVSSAGVVTTLAGLAGEFGSTNGTGSSARLNFPYGLAIAGNGDVYIADSSNHLIRKMTPSGVVSTVAGTPGFFGFQNGTASTARFRFPSALAIDLQGDLYIADSGNHTIRRLSANGMVTTFAGTPDVAGSVDGNASTARFRIPRSVVVDVEGNVFVSDNGNHTIRKITPQGVVSTLAGVAGEAGAVDGAGGTARLSGPEGLALDADGNLYVADAGNNTIRRITPAGEVSTVAGVANRRGVTPGPLPGALNSPIGLVIGKDGALYVSDEGGILRITLDAPVRLFDVRLVAPEAITVGGSFTLYWRATNATACTATGPGWNGPVEASGSLTVATTTTGVRTYTLNCAEDGGPGTLERTVSVAVNPPAPVVTLSAAQSRVDPGGPGTTLTWTATDADSCTASGAWSGARATGGGSEAVTPATTSTYVLTCTGGGGTTTTQATVVVAFAPTLTFEATPRKVRMGDTVVLSWNAQHVTSCSANGSWTGTRPVSGSQALEVVSSLSQVYRLVCIGPGGVVEDAEVVEVSFATSTSGDAGGSGGVAGLEWLIGGLALAGLRRRLARERRATP